MLDSSKAIQATEISVKVIIGHIVLSEQICA